MREHPKPVISELRKEVVHMRQKIEWAGRILTALAALPFVASSIMKLVGLPQVYEGIKHLGLRPEMVKPLGVLELACVLVYLIPRTSVLGAVLLTGYLGGAICTHWRVEDPFFVQVILGVVVWAG